ncbi:mitogen-activated protein kinase mpkC [Penicillium hispanicum]|uniref:mitogen-activated protein kinase mpkC n=1 Tax=Penicillium hispanicum TaxID=1080232 RepID=UPI0025401F7A|nr:mitogen-activated protein kinase mpkC [Penicillium hispanicum]KAJ5593997.1 mitogen-activated protein kinase mpkC [Penicillium hispanicum]
MTGYVSTRFYRAPEIMLTWQNYSGPIDIWSAACIFAEMLQGTPMFPGASHVDQFHKIVNILGNPPPQIVDTIRNRHVRGNPSASADLADPGPI